MYVYLDEDGFTLIDPPASKLSSSISRALAVKFYQKKKKRTHFLVGGAMLVDDFSLAKLAK